MKSEDSPFKFRHVPKKDKTEDEIERKMGGRLTENSLSTEQHLIFDRVCRWYEHGNGDTLTLGGYAGTGKSTLISVLAGKYPDEEIAFAAYTGKATSVLRKKFYEANVPANRHDTSTLHSLMYQPIVDDDTGRIRGWKRRAHLDCELVVVDEASMVDKQLYDDLLSYEIPILAVGDHGQLPPVFGDFNLMEKPLLKLETIHRQAEGSPILGLSEIVRCTGQVPRPTHNTPELQILELSVLPSLVETLFQHKDVRLDDVGLLCHTNRERVDLNRRARKARWGAADGLREGDQVICLRNTEATIFNGMRGIVQQLFPRYETPFHYYGCILFEDDEILVEGPICKPQFDRENTFKDFDEYYQETGQRVRSWNSVGLLLDYGMALTVHKSQGSQWEHVVVVNRPFYSMSFDMKKRALYTAVTRCSKYLAVLQE